MVKRERERERGRGRGRGGEREGEREERERERGERGREGRRRERGQEDMKREGDTRTDPSSVSLSERLLGIVVQMPLNPLFLITEAFKVMVLSQGNQGD